jgi:hypothetical protein
LSLTYSFTSGTHCPRSLLIRSLDITTLHIAGTVATVQPTSTVNAIPTSSLQRAKTVRLPYSLVPSMDLNSVAFQKAIATLGKQQSKTSASPLDSSTTRFKRTKLDHITSHQDLSKFLILFSSSIAYFSASCRLLPCSPGHK